MITKPYLARENNESVLAFMYRWVDEANCAIVKACLKEENETLLPNWWERSLFQHWLTLNVMDEFHRKPTLSEWLSVGAQVVDKRFCEDEEK